MIEFGPDEIEDLANRLNAARSYHDGYSCGMRVTRYFDLGPEDVKLASKLLLAMMRLERKADR